MQSQLPPPRPMPNATSYEIIPASTPVEDYPAPVAQPVITEQPRPFSQYSIDTSAQRLMRVQLKGNQTVYGAIPRPETVITVQPKPGPYIQYQDQDPGPFAQLYWYDIPCCICTEALCKVAEGCMAVLNCRPCCPK